MDSNIHFSRPIATALHLGDDAPDKNLFLDKQVLLTAETDILKTENGKNCFWSSLLLLIRICKSVDVCVPHELNDLENIYRSNLTIINPVIAPTFVRDEVKWTQYDAILNVGKTARHELPWTVINSNGWLLRVSSGSSNIPAVCDQVNPIAALAAACLGVTEVFKRLIKLRDDRGRLLDRLIFSLYSYGIEEDDYGPLLPDNIAVDLLVTGAGAIGNGVIYLLGFLPIIGYISVVDSQQYQGENLGTCLLIGQEAIGKEKAIFAAEYLKDRHITAKGYPEKVDEFSKRLGKEIAYPKIIINGLDNIDARHDVQSLWPDIIIDGAIGNFSCQVSRHPWEENIACLKCLFRKVPSTSADEIASEVTGLNLQRVKNALEIVREEDVKSAPEHKQEFLRKNIGKQICSVIEEGMVQKISREKQQEGFAPSVPFVACFSAAMVISELIKFVSKFPSNLEPRFQFDILRGPAFGMEIPQERRGNCICVERRINIDLVRSER